MSLSSSPIIRSVLQVKHVLFFVFFVSLNPHLLPVRSNLLPGHSLPASDNSPTFAFLMRLIIPPRITLSATCFTFRQAASLLVSLFFLNPAVNGDRSSVFLRPDWKAAGGKTEDGD